MQLTANGKILPSPHFKTLLIMKMLGIFLFAACLSANANISAQTVTLKADRSSLEKVLREVRKQTGYDFVLNNSVITVAKPITVDADKMALEAFLEKCFKDQPLTYEILPNKTIIIKEKKILGSLTLDLSPGLPLPTPPPSDVTIIVTNEQGQALEGASITVKGNNKGLITDLNGRVTFKAVDDAATLVISFTGYLPQEIRINKRTVISIKLVQSTSELDQIQIVAYGTQSKRYNLGDVTTVTSSDIEKQPVNNPLLAIQNRVPGLIITQNSGLAGSSINIQIRGRNSVSTQTDPFYVVDGVPYQSQMITNQGNGLLGNGNPISFLNPDDIESISVLKDAGATSIYGSQAANGAILITTKRGKIGKTQVKLNLQNGWGSVSNKLKMMNATEYLQMRHEALRNDGLAIGAADYDLNGTWDTTRVTNWQKELSARTTQYTNLNASVSGGTQGIQYMVGATYHRETPPVPGAFSLQNASVHFNISSTSLNQRFKMQLTGNYMSSVNVLPTADPTVYSNRLAPIAPNLYNPDGTLNWQYNASGTATFQNPLAALTTYYQNNVTNLVSNLLLSYQLATGLSIETSLGYTNMLQNDLSTTPLTSYNPGLRTILARSAAYSNNASKSYIIEPKIAYIKAIGKGYLDALIGSTIRQAENNGLLLSGSGYSSDLVLKDIKAASNVTIGTSTQNIYKYNALFGRANYRYLNKYIAEFSIRRDGSSRFGSANQFHNFMSGGAGWIFSEEKTIKEHLSFLSFGKFKASYGTTGNDQIGDYKSLNLYAPYTVPVAYQGVGGLQVTGLTNPYLQWEETKKLELGIELGFIKDRILFNASYYRNRSSNLLLAYSLPIFTGFNSITLNFPATIQNSGSEFSLSTKTITTKNFSWKTNFNLTLPVDYAKLVSFPGLATSTYASTYQIGHSASEFRAYHYLGVNPTTGIYQFADKQGNATSTPNALTDRTSYINTAAPNFYGGIGNSITYKNFQFDLFIQFTSKTVTNGFFGVGFIPGTFGSAGAQPAFLLDRWQKPGDIAGHQKYNSNSSVFQYLNNAMNSDAAYTKVFYARLGNASLAWVMPETLLKKLHFQAAKIFLDGQNLYTFKTNFFGIDPETAFAGGVPPMRVITIGINVGL